MMERESGSGSGSGSGRERPRGGRGMQDGWADVDIRMRVEKYSEQIQ